MVKNSLQMVRSALLTLVVGVGTLVGATAHAATYYVRPGGTDSSSANGSTNQPWATPTYAVTRIRGGDTVIVRAGTYTNQYIVIGGTLSGTAATHTVFKAETSTKPIIKGGRPESIFAVDGATYVDVTGFDVSNNYKDPTYGGGSGIRCIGASNHITISYNEVHDCGANGITSEYRSDYVIIDHNSVHNCAGYNPYHCSGISIFNQDWSDYTNQGVHSQVTNNLSYNNSEGGGHWDPDPSKGAGYGGNHTDGNGIIIDTGTQFWSPHSLVSGNNCWNNGGRGIVVTLDSNVLIQNNIVASNLTDPIFNNTTEGELSAISSHNCDYINNTVTSYSGRFYDYSYRDSYITSYGNIGNPGNVYF